MEPENPHESFKFEFFGCKLETVNPGIKSIVLLLILIGFVIMAIVLLKEFVLPLSVLAVKKAMISLIK